MSGTVGQYWEVITEVAAPIATALGQADDAARARIREQALERARQFEVDGDVRMPQHARVISATA